MRQLYYSLEREINETYRACISNAALMNVSTMCTDRALLHSSYSRCLTYTHTSKRTGTGIPQPSFSPLYLPIFYSFLYLHKQIHFPLALFAVKGTMTLTVFCNLLHTTLNLIWFKLYPFRLHIKEYEKKNY